ncbi:MAG: hypothetical protein A4E42_00121 [Methanoregulaceae archaeon PtaU1.Bin222]|nr:MAG: hypothetical protein A4E42_00121 [Methanoregulaceae archaeon PtaU1.Bin222]
MPGDLEGEFISLALDCKAYLVYEFSELRLGIPSFLEVKIRTAIQGIYDHMFPPPPGENDKWC